MNAFNRLILLIVALLLIVVPVFLLLVNFGVISANLVNQYTNYRSDLNALGGVTNLNLTMNPTRIIVGVVGAVVAIIALLFLLRELTFGRVVARSAVIEDSPGAETRLTATAVRSLAEGAARESGAAEPSVSLSSHGDPYRIACRIKVPRNGNYTEIASRTRDNIRRVLEDQNVQVRDVEVTVRGNSEDSRALPQGSRDGFATETEGR